MLTQRYDGISVLQGEIKLYTEREIKVGKSEGRTWLLHFFLSLMLSELSVNQMEEVKSDDRFFVMTNHEYWFGPAGEQA